MRHTTLCTVALLASALTMTACNRYAKLETQPGVIQRVELRSSDATTLYGLAPDGSRVSIPRSEVRDVTLPGNVAIPVYAVLTGVSAIACGGAGYAWLAEDEKAALVGVVVFGLTTLGAVAPLIWYASQRSDAADVIESNVAPGFSVAPTAVRDRNGHHEPGLALSVAF